jgi:hypothetical protein
MDLIDRKENGRKGGLIGRLAAIKLGLEYRKQYESSPKYCKYCNNNIPYEQPYNNFCNHSCSAKYNNLNRIKLPKSHCLWCGKLLQGTDVKCCRNGKCKLLYKVKCFLNGDIKTIPDKKSIKAYYIFIRGHICESCKSTKWMGNPIPLELHHKDGNKYNQSDENIILLCPNCHSFTDTFCGKNVGKYLHLK